MKTIVKPVSLGAFENLFVKEEVVSCKLHLDCVTFGIAGPDDLYYEETFYFGEIYDPEIGVLEKVTVYADGEICRDYVRPIPCKKVGKSVTAEKATKWSAALHYRPMKWWEKVFKYRK